MINTTRIVKDDFGGICCFDCIGFVEPLDSPVIGEESIPTYLANTIYAACSVCDKVFVNEKDVWSVSIREYFEKILNSN